jgi:serine/threonine-protein kinase
MEPTTAARFRRVREIFEELVEETALERGERLSSIALEDPGLAAAVRELLEADRRAQGYLSSPAADLLGSTAGGGPASPGAGSPLGELMGAWRVLEPLGAGGMGEVFLAERADGRFEQRVALKLVKRGMDTAQILRRFARERQILARLEHPGIARLLDGGEAADGRPFFVMELASGQPITDYCRSRESSLEERLRLLIDCCDAVDAAHRNLVVHRDLKPSNILVTPEGRIKLLDFGIARLVGEDDGETQLTRQGAQVLTPAYAAPEQILGGGVTMATDVFALGVMLYELLTGALPYDRRATTPLDLVSRVERESAERPSTVVRRGGAATEGGRAAERRARPLRGDLDTIVLKALSREPERRYPSAAAFAADLPAYLEGRPVAARPDSALYRTRKFVGRHRLAVAASAAVAIALVGALAVSLYQTAIARRQAARAAAAQAYLTGLFADVDPDRAAGAAPTVRELLERGAGRLDVELASEPELHAEMEMLLGQVYGQLSLPDQAEPLLRSAAARYRGLRGEADRQTIEAERRLAVAIHRQARYAEAEPIFRDLQERAEALGEKADLASVLSNYGNLKRQTGDYAGAAALLRRAVSVAGSRGDLDSVTLATAVNNLGLVYWRQNRLHAATRAFERALGIHQKNRPGSGLVAGTLGNLSEVSRDLGDLDAAERYGNEALALQRAIYGPSHPAVAATIVSLASLARRRGDVAGAESLFRQAIATYAASQRPDHPDLAFALRGLANTLRQENRLREAVAAYEQALAVRRKAFGDRHPDVAQSWHDLARGKLALDDLEGALAALRTGVEIYRATLPADSSQLAGGLFLLGDVLRQNGRARVGIPYLEEALRIWRAKPPSNPVDLANLEAALADARKSAR